MPRIRSLKPEIASDAKLSSISIPARYTFVLMITQADDAGLLPGAHRQILGTLYPLDDDVTVPILLSWIEELVGIGLVRWRATRDNIPVLQLINWAKHQRIDNAGRSQLGALLAESPGDSPQQNDGRGDSPQSAASRGESPLGPPITDHGSPTMDHQVVVDADAIAHAAMQLTVRANQGLADHDQPAKRQPIARIIATAAKSHAAAESILRAGVPLAFAEDATYELARTHGADDEIRHLTYFPKGIIRMWQQKQATDAAANGGRPTSRNGRRPRAAANPGFDKIGGDE